MTRPTHLPHRRTRLIALVAGLVLAGAPTALRADIVLHDGGVNKDRDAANRVKTRTQEAPRLVLPSAVLAGPTQILSGETNIERCEGGSMPLDVTNKLTLIEDKVLNFEPDSALQTLSVVSTLLPCSDSIIAAEQLAKLSFLRGAALSDLGKDEAAAAMSEALAFVPDYSGEKGFPRTHSQLLETTRERMSSLPDGRVFLWPGPGTEQVHVDGTLYDQAHSVGISLRPGLHLVQLLVEDTIQGLWVMIGSRFSAIVFPGAGRAVWADGGRSPGGELAMRLMLEEGFHGREGDIHTLQYRGRSVSGATWPVDGGPRVAWEPEKRRRMAKSRRTAKPSQEPSEAQPSATGDESLPSAKPEQSAPEATASMDTSEDGDPQGTVAEGATVDDPGEPSPSPSDTEASTGSKPTEIKAMERVRRFRLSVGGGYQFAEPFSYGLLALDFSVRVVGPVQVVASLRPSLGGVYEYPVPSGVEPISGPVGFMPIGVGAGVAMDAKVSPYVRALFQFAYNRDGLSATEYLVGAVVQGGAEFLLPNVPIFLSIQGEAGILGTRFNGRAWLGIGVAF
ncbi:MAG TPA: hypothetical protein DIU15_00785 [Deltaproteobacteria bacterium]|nr:hypothetical protein [Deltaproteobacteria bacterium]HCP44564.1 hypothetical protein [Deltaproteobacteria bacterium]